MNNVEFYTRYNNLAIEYSALDSRRSEMKPKDERIKQYELDQEMNKLFDDMMGTKIDIFA